MSSASLSNMILYVYFKTFSKCGSNWKRIQRTLWVLGICNFLTSAMIKMGVSTLWKFSELCTFCVFFCMNVIVEK